jgi:hypothetical protein
MRRPWARGAAASSGPPSYSPIRPHHEPVTKTKRGTDSPMAADRAEHY